MRPLQEAEAALPLHGAQFKREECSVVVVHKTSRMVVSELQFAFVQKKIQAEMACEIKIAQDLPAAVTHGAMPLYVEIFDLSMFRIFKE